MAQDEIGVGIIGTGFGVRVQLPLWHHTPGARRDGGVQPQ